MSHDEKIYGGKTYTFDKHGTLIDIKEIPDGSILRYDEKGYYWEYQDRKIEGKSINRDEDFKKEYDEEIMKGRQTIKGKPVGHDA